MVGVVLVGGKSKRFGRNKALEVFQGERLIDRQVRVLRSQFPEVLVISNEPELYFHLGETIVRDVIPGQGPLGGIYTGLLFAHGESIFVTACDMPFLQPSVVGHMVKLAANYDVVIPETKNGLEPLHAVYSSGCLPHIKKMLNRRELQVIGFLPRVKVHRLRVEWLEQLDPHGFSFFNINTPEDMVEAERLFEQLRQ